MPTLNYALSGGNNNNLITVPSEEDNMFFQINYANVVSTSLVVEVHLSAQQNGTYVKKAGADLTLVPATNSGIIILNDVNYAYVRFKLTGAVAALATPSTPTATPSITGGTLAAGTYFYKVTALNATGETVGSGQASATTTGTTSSVALAWGAVTGASSYRIYRGTTSNGQNVYYTSASASFTDVNGTSTAGTVPVTGTSGTAGTITDVFAKQSL